MRRVYLCVITEAMLRADKAVTDSQADTNTRQLYPSYLLYTWNELALLAHSF